MILQALRLRRSLLTAVLLLFASVTGPAAATEGLPEGMRSGTIDVDGGSLYYEIAGSGGKSLILIHDGLLHREVYDGQFAPFAEHFTVVRYDRRGYGRSPAPEAPYSDLDDLFRLFDVLKIEKASLLGMSAGGRLSVDFTLAHPDRVEALVLVGPVVSGLGFTDHFFSRGGRQTLDDRTDAASLGRFYTMEDPYEFAPETTAARERAWALLQANLQNLDFSRGRLLQRPPSAIGRLGEIAVPTLIVVGEHDIPDVHAHTGALEAGIPGARRVIVRGAGHIVPMERPEEFNDAALGFLKGAEFYAALRAGDAARAAAVARRLRAADPGFTPAPENELNAAGYRFLQEGRPAEAVEIFRLNAELHPDSWNAWDSLGEGQAAAGETEAAIASYRKSLELNPDNANGRQAIERLEERRLREAGETAGSSTSTERKP